MNAYEVNAGMVCLQCKNCVIHAWVLQRWVSYDVVLYKFLYLYLFTIVYGTDGNLSVIACCDHDRLMAIVLCDREERKRLQDTTLAWVIRQSRRQVIRTVQVTMRQIHFPALPSHQKVPFSLQLAATLLHVRINKCPKEDLCVSQIIPASPNILLLWYANLPACTKDACWDIYKVFCNYFLYCNLTLIFKFGCLLIFYGIKMTVIAYSLCSRLYNRVENFMFFWTMTNMQIVKC